MSQGMSKFCHKVRNSSNLLFVVAAVSSKVRNLLTLFWKFLIVGYSFCCKHLYMYYLASIISTFIITGFLFCVPSKISFVDRMKCICVFWYIHWYMVDQKSFITSHSTNMCGNVSISSSQNVHISSWASPHCKSFSFVTRIKCSILNLILLHADPALLLELTQTYHDFRHTAGYVPGVAVWHFNWAGCH